MNTGTTVRRMPWQAIAAAITVSSCIPDGAPYFTVPIGVTLRWYFRCSCFW